MEFETRNSGGDVLSAVTTGAAEFGGIGIGASLYNAVYEGLPVRLAAPLTFTHREDYVVISPEYASSPEEATELYQDATPLAGATFAISGRGTGTHGTVRAMLAQSGMAEDDIRLEEITPFSAMVQALAQGAIDVGVIIDPFATQAEMQQIGYRPTRPAAEPDYMNSGLVVNQEWASENEATAVAFMEALHLAAADIEENGWYSDKNLEYISEYTGTDDTEAIVAGRPPDLYGDLRVDEQEDLDYQDDLIDSGEVLYAERIPFEDVWDLRWRDSALEANS